MQTRVAVNDPFISVDYMEYMYKVSEYFRFYGHGSAILQSLLRGRTVCHVSEKHREDVGSSKEETTSLAIV